MAQRYEEYLKPPKDLKKFVVEYPSFIKGSHLPHQRLAPSTINANYQSEASELTVRTSQSV